MSYWNKNKGIQEPTQEKTDIEKTLYLEIFPEAQKAGYKYIDWDEKEPRRLITNLRELEGVLTTKDFDKYMGWRYIRAKQLKYSELLKDEKIKYKYSFNSETDKRLKTSDYIDNFGYSVGALEGRR